MNSQAEDLAAHFDNVDDPLRTGEDPSIVSGDVPQPADDDDDDTVEVPGMSVPHTGCVPTGT